MDIAIGYPLLFDQLYFDWEAAFEREREQSPQWRKPGEKAVDARNRLREGREKAKRDIEARLAAQENV